MKRTETSALSTLQLYHISLREREVYLRKLRRVGGGREGGEWRERKEGEAGEEGGRGERVYLRKRGDRVVETDGVGKGMCLEIGERVS